LAKISVVLPVYNGLAYLGEAVASILSQDVDLELVISDDGSTDGSAQFVAGLNDPRIRVLTNEANLGIFGNLNRAISETQGELIQIFSQDDVMRPGYLASQADVLRRYPSAGMVYGAPVGIDENGAVAAGGETEDTTPEFVDGRLYVWIASHFGALPASISSVMIRRATFDTIGLFDPSFRVAGDIEFYNRLSERFGIARNPHALHAVRSHRGMTSALSSSGLRYLREELRLEPWYRAQWSAADYKKVRLYRSGLRGTQHLGWIVKHGLRGRLATSLVALVLLNRLYPLTAISRSRLRRMLGGEGAAAPLVRAPRASPLPAEPT
jgi:glycosyltransferase involved in cell wall biosynthesis